MKHKLTKLITYSITSLLLLTPVLHQDITTTTDQYTVYFSISTSIASDIDMHELATPYFISNIFN